MIKGVVMVFGVIIVVGIVVGVLLLLARALGFVRFQFRRGPGGKLYSVPQSRHRGGDGPAGPTPPGA